MISAIKPRSASQATLVTGLLGSGKTWHLVNQLLLAAKSQTSRPDSSIYHHDHGSLLVLGNRASCTAMQQAVDLGRPLGCTKCNVITFPILVQSIVEEFGPTVGSYTPIGGRLLDRGNAAVFLHRNLDALPLGKYRPVHTPGEAIKPLLNLFSNLAHYGIFPEDYLKYVDNLEAELGHTRMAVVEHDGGGQGAGGVAGVGEEPATRAQLNVQLEAEAWREHVARERDKANSYEAFVALKQREEVADFSDHLLLARRILNESVTARATMSLRLSHVYVDDLHEYSPTMVDILAGLVTPSGVGITASVDPYLAMGPARSGMAHSFGAEHTAAALFKKAFPGTVELPLTGSRQKTDAIIGAMRALKPRGTSVLKKKITKTSYIKDESPIDDATAKPAAESTSPLQDEQVSLESTIHGGSNRLTCLTFQTEDDELKALGRSVRDLVDRGVSLGDIGVAAVGRWGVSGVLTAALSAAGVPVDGGKHFSSLFDKETPRMVMSFLRCLVHPSESTPLLHLLMDCPAYALPGGELMETLEGHLSRYVPLRSFLRDSIHLGGGGSGSSDSLDEGGVSVGARDMARRLLSDLDRFAGAARTKGVREVILDFLRHTGQLERLEEPTTKEEEEEGQAVAKLFDIIVMAEKQAGGDKVALVEPILRLFRRHGVRSTVDSRFDKEEAASGGGKEGGLSGGAVVVFQPLQDSKAIGQTFHTVFIPFCNHVHFPGYLRTESLPVPGPFRGTLEPRDAASLRSDAALARAFHENRSRATLYAAIGSARKDVCFSLSARIIRGKSHLAPSPFLFEILGRDAPREWKIAPLKQERDGEVDVVAESAADMPCSSLVSTGSGDIGAALPLRLSFSSISSYASCPHSYYLQYVLNVSPPPNPRMVYGRLMHEAVATFLRSAIEDGGGPPPSLQAAAVHDFQVHFGGCAFESGSQVRTLTANGIAGLESFVVRLLEGRVNGGAALESEKGQKGLQTHLVERKFMVKIPEADVVLTGIFDRVDMVSGGGTGSLASLVSITDYKSNVGAKNPRRMVKNNLQLQLYSLAAERLFGVVPVELAIESIEDGRRGVSVPTKADADIALEAISVTAAAVRAKIFDATPSFQTCTFCGFKHMCRHSSITNSVL